MKESIYNLPHVNLNYAKGHNNGPSVLMLHGNMSRWEAFSAIIPDIENITHSYALDLRGHGKSSHVNGTYTLQDHLGDVVSFIQHKITDPVILVGVSLGGMIGLLAAAHYPELIKGLIILDSPLSTKTLFSIIKSQTELGERILHYLQTNQIDQLYQEINNDSFCENIRTCDIKILKTTFYQYEEMVKGYELDTLFPAVKCPTIILRGEQALGSMIADNDIIDAIKLAPHLHDIKIPNVGHSLLDKKEIVIKSVIDLIKSL